MSGAAGSGYHFGGEKSQLLKRRLRAIQVATDRGNGHRCITHDRTNPYDLDKQSLEHAAWEAGWQQADRELGRSDA